MRTSLMDFTRGSQVAETIAMMFGTALRPMIYTALAIVTAAIGWLIWTETEPGDSYYWLMHVYASAWLWMKFNADKLLGLKTLTRRGYRERSGSMLSKPSSRAECLTAASFRRGETASTPPVWI